MKYYLDKIGLAALWAAIKSYVAEQVASVGGAASDGYLVSADSNVIVTHEFKAGVEATAHAAIPGGSNVIKGFTSGTHKIGVSLALIRGLNANTALAAGPLPSGKLGNTAGADMLLYSDGILAYCDGDGHATAILTLDGGPALAAGDIAITA